MFRGVSKAILAALAITMTVCASAHAGPIWGAWDAASVDPRPLYLATTAAPDAGPPSPDVVRETQDLLAALGYRPGPADGVWGRRTAIAFRAFLRDAGLPAADSLTPDALRALRRLAARPQEAADRPAPPTPPPPPEAVREAQDLLAALGYRPDPADGIWGGRTASAFRAFLRDAGLPAADSLTPDTLRALRRLAAQQAPTAPIWRDSEQHGQGTHTWPNGERHVGNWRNDKANGQGTRTWPNGQRYEGNWRDDKRNGQGTHTWPNGERHVGNWRNDKMNGQGTHTWPNGQRYEGNWRDDKRNGQGTYTWPNGERRVGNWRNGKMNGQGTHTWPNGERYEGNWRNDKPQGWGAFTDANGNNFVGEWSRGCYDESDGRWAVLTTLESCGF